METEEDENTLLSNDLAKWRAEVQKDLRVVNNSNFNIQQNRASQVQRHKDKDSLRQPLNARSSTLNASSRQRTTTKSNFDVMEITKKMEMKEAIIYENALPEQNTETYLKKKGKPSFFPLLPASENSATMFKQEQPDQIANNNNDKVDRIITSVMMQVAESRSQTGAKPGIMHRVVQGICGTGGTKSSDEDEDAESSGPDSKKSKFNSSNPRKKNHKGPSKKAIRQEKARKARKAGEEKKEDAKVYETLSAEQKALFDALNEKFITTAAQLAEEKSINKSSTKEISTLKEKIANLQAKFENKEAENIKLHEKNEEMESVNKQQLVQLINEKRQKESLDKKLQRSKSCEAELFSTRAQLKSTSKQLDTSTKTIEILNTGQEKLRQTLAKNEATTKTLLIQNAALQTKEHELQQHINEISEILEAMEKVVQSSLTAPLNTSSATAKAPPSPTSFSELAQRTQQKHVQDAVEFLDKEPVFKEKLVKRLLPKVAKTQQKMTANQAVAMAVSLGMSQTKIEKLKSFLRMINMDFLPTVVEIRNLTKGFKNQYQYVTVEDKEKKIYCRRAASILELIKLRAKRLMESGNFEEIPGYEDCLFIGITADKGGGSIKVACTCCNAKKGKSSPNDLTIIGVANAPKDDYDTFKFCFGESFDEINDLDEKFIEFEVNGEIVRRKILFIVCCDGKMQSCLSGHSGASSSNPCYCCEATKEEINQRIKIPLREASKMKEQADKFVKEKCTRAECKSITKPPICTIPYNRWVYGALHAVQGPAVAVLNKVEEIALNADLKDLGITISNKKEVKQKALELQQEINGIKAELDEAKRALKTSKTVIPKWKKKRKCGTSEKQQSECNAKYCVKNMLPNEPSLFSTCLNCKSCGNFVHASCDLQFLSHEIDDAQSEEGFICSHCSLYNDEENLEDILDRQKEWEESINILKNQLHDKEKSDENISIPYDRCIRYQKIQTKLKELNVRKTRGFQTLNGIDIRRLVKNGDSFSESVPDELQNAVKNVFSCLDKYQKFAKPKLLTDEDINSLDKEKLLDSYQEICGDNITPKLHDLTEHAPDFMSEFHFYQFVSDQPIENCHSLSNYLLRSQTNAKQQDQLQLKAITDNFCLRNMLFDAGLNVGNLRKKKLAEKQAMMSNLQL